MKGETTLLKRNQPPINKYTDRRVNHAN